MFPYKLKANYSFNTYAPAILGTRIRNAKLLAILDYDVASNYTTPNISHANIFPYLPVGTVDNPEAYTYLLFQTDEKTKIVFANTWIQESTITEQTNSKLTIVIENISTGDETKIRDLLLLSGFKPQMVLT